MMALDSGTNLRGDFNAESVSHRLEVRPNRHSESCKVTQYEMLQKVVFARLEPSPIIPVLVEICSKEDGIHA